MNPTLLQVVVLAQAQDPLAAYGGTDALNGLMAGGTLIGLVLTVLFFIWLGLLGILLPWFVWRTKVYAKRQYLLTRRLCELLARQRDQ